MKKYFYPSLILVLVIALIFMYKKYDNAKNTIPALKERAVNVSATGEWLNTKQAIEGLIDKIRRHPEDVKAKLQLAMAYVQESRVTGNHAYYDEAAMTLVNQVLAKEIQNFDALCVKATLLLSQHHFADALTTANEIVKLYPEAAYGYGLLCDAEVELGHYEAAVQAADKMMNIRPDLRSYARMAYLREIHGDYEGAKKAMRYAVESGVPGLEQTEWCRVQLGRLHETTGDTAMAATIYRSALAYRPDYAYALAGLGRLAGKKGNFTEGVALLEKANESVVDFVFYDEIADLYKAQNQGDKYNLTVQRVIKMLAQHATDDKAAPDKGHYADLELAYAYLKIKDVDNALMHATREWNRRPDNIQVNECMAWVYFNKNDVPNAVKYIEKALKTNSQNPTLLARAGEIFIKNNELEKGKSFKNKALQVNKNFKL
jgi:tetratricopeptide (TPR) repeat protein